MSDKELTKEKLSQIYKATDKIVEWFEGIESPEDFLLSSENVKTLDAICMRLIAIGEEVKNIDDITSGDFLARYSNIPWKNVMGMRDIISHHYSEINPETVFKVCEKRIPELRKTLEKMLKEFD